MSRSPLKSKEHIHTHTPVLSYSTQWSQSQHVVFIDHIHTRESTTPRLQSVRWTQWRVFVVCSVSNTNNCSCCFWFWPVLVMTLKGPAKLQQTYKQTWFLVHLCLQHKDRRYTDATDRVRDVRTTPEPCGCFDNIPLEQKLHFLLFAAAAAVLRVRLFLEQRLALSYSGGKSPVLEFKER